MAVLWAGRYAKYFTNVDSVDLFYQNLYLFMVSLPKQNISSMLLLLLSVQLSFQSCPTLRPHRRQLTRLPRPWDSPGKNTGVGCHFLLQCMKVKSESEVAQSCPASRLHGLQPTRLLHPWDFPGKSTGVGCRCLFRIQFLVLANISQVALYRSITNSQLDCPSL